MTAWANRMQRRNEERRARNAARREAINRERVAKGLPPLAEKRSKIKNEEPK